MNAAGRVIVLEFNELTPALIDRFSSDGDLPNFSRMRDESLAFVTEAEERAPYLEPWIQWVTVHTGLNFRDHGLAHLDEGDQLRAKRVWDVVSDHGGSVWICGSMNVNYGPGLRGAVLPDPWCTKVKPTPAELGPYCSFVQRNVLEYTNDKVPLTASDYAAFMWFMTTHGLSPSTVQSIVSQLLAERRSDCRWRRAALLDQIQFDVFKAMFRRIRPAFSTFFINSTAHFQHTYWRNMEPERFTVKPTDEEQQQYADAIRYGYKRMDDLVGRFLDLAGDDATVVFCTALSQQPFLRFENVGGTSFYRPTDFERVAQIAGITAPHKVVPVMAHQFHLEFESDEEAERARARLVQLTLHGKKLMQAERTGNRIYCGCDFYAQIPEDAAIVVGDTGSAVPFFKVFYRVDAMKSGMHHPDGIFWIRMPQRRRAASSEKVPLDAVAPTLLSMLGLPIPDQMARPPITRKLATASGPRPDRRSCMTSPSR